MKSDDADFDNDDYDDDDENSSCATISYNEHVVSLLLLSGSFFCLFAPFSAIQNLESSLNASDKLGATALATLYLVYTAGCLLAPAIVGTFGPTRSMIGSGIFVCIFIGAHFHPTWRSLIPASVLVGLGCAFMWAAQGVYITKIAVNYAESTGEENRFAFLGLFNGIFWGLFNCNQVAGNLISSMILKSGQSPSILAKLFTVFLFLSSFAVLSLFFLPSPAPRQQRRRQQQQNDDVEKKISTTTNKSTNNSTNNSDNSDTTEPKEEEKEKEKTASLEVMLSSMITILGNKEILLLLPMFLYSGVVFGFLCSDFTNNLVRESLGVHEIGLVMSVFGLGDGLACLLFGKLSDFVGRPPIIMYGVVVHFIIFLFLLTWNVKADATVTLYCVAWFYGTADAAWCTQIYAIIGERFPNTMEAAFSTYRMWNSIGMAGAFYASAHWNWHLKVVLLIFLVTLSAVGYIMLLMMDNMNNNNNNNNDMTVRQRLTALICGTDIVKRGTKKHSPVDVL